MSDFLSSAAVDIFLHKQLCIQSYCRGDKKGMLCPAGKTYLHKTGYNQAKKEHF